MNTPKDRAGNRLLTVASVLLALLAVAQGYVSFAAQFDFVNDVKRDTLASVLEALGLDVGAVIFALLAIAAARLGRKALIERALNVACAAGALAMNAMAADSSSPKELAVYVMPSLLYVAASDRLIAVVRQRVLNPVSTGGDLDSAEVGRTEIEPENDELREMTNAEALRMALDDLGLDATIEDVQGWLRRRGFRVHRDDIEVVRDSMKRQLPSDDEIAAFIDDQERRRHMKPVQS